MKRHSFYLSLIAYILMGLPASLWAQDSFTNHYNITYFTMNEGLPHNFVDDIYKDSHGFLWISMASGGLSRYDGYEFINFSPSTPYCKLKSNFISNVYEDNFQRLWIVSEGGIDIIDLQTMQNVLPDDPKGKLTPLLNRPASHVERSADGCIWVHCDNRLNRICFEPDGSISNIQSLQSPYLQRKDVFFKDVESDGKVWIGLNGKIYKVEAGTNGNLQEKPVAQCLTFTPDVSCSDFIAKENEIWISTNEGLFRYNKNENIVKQYRHDPKDRHSLSQNFLSCLAVTNDKQLMVASLKGINIYNPIKDNFDRIGDQYYPTGSNLLNSNFVNCIYIEGKHIWIGTESGGINKLSYKRLNIQNYRNNPKDPATLSNNPVNAIYEEANGTLWVGTVEGGLNRKLPNSNDFTHYTHENGKLSHNSVSVITADPEGHLWVGSWGGGISILDLKKPNNVVKTLITNQEMKFPINFVGTLTYDPINNGMWIGANQGIFFYDLKTQTIHSPLADQPTENIYGCIGSCIDRNGQLWIGCLEGVYIIDLHSYQEKENSCKYRQLKYKLDEPASGLIEKICYIYEAKDGTLWLGSNGYGIYKRTVDKEGKEHFVNYNTADGLPNNSTRSILEDDKGNLWIATNNGLSCFLPTQKLFINYTQQDGLAGTQFYWNAAFRSAGNELYFGSVAGLTAIKGFLPTVYAPLTPLRFTKLTIGNQEILPGNMPTDISVATSISIHEREKSFSVEFSALNFEPSNTATYSYRLVGFDDKWIEVANDRRFASYTNLSPGNYTLQIKYTPYDSEASSTLTELKITIEPYFYKTIWFMLLVFIIVAMGVWQFYQWRIRTLKQQKELLHRKVEQRTYELNEQKRLLEEQTQELSCQNQKLTEQNEKITHQKVQLAKMTRKVQEVTLEKISFFTNITHEFRTPITLIIGPIERALKLSYNPQVIEQLHFVERNSKYLLSLINQLMDFRKVESGKIEIVKAKNDFTQFVRELLAPFEAFAHERNIRVNLYCRMPETEIFYDEEAMHKVFTNLLSNAIKFTPNGGCVSVFIATLPDNDNRNKKLYINVSDTGSGIPADDLTKIFNRFYQSQNQTKYPMYGQAGSGIGLYLCKRIIQLLGGEIEARNNPSTGCSFRLLIPLSEEEGLAKETIDGLSATSPEGTTLATPSEKRKDLRILVVEDNTDMRGYIRSILRDKFDVVEAANGAEALNVLTAQNIDFIISDLMMPVMDGIELSRRVKENFAISHIPFLMLTAKTSQQSRIDSYRMGVDEYLLKPFDETLLLTRIDNILENRKRYQRKFAINMDVEALNIDEESSDKKFINRIMEVVKEHYKNPNFEVSDFCEAAGISKTLLNQKLQSLLGQSPNHFIRNYRLSLARELILKHRNNKEISVAEIAYEVGFNDPKYFTRCFIKEFNVKPSSLLSEEKSL